MTSLNPPNPAMCSRCRTHQHRHDSEFCGPCIDAIARENAIDYLIGALECDPRNVGPDAIMYEAIIFLLQKEKERVQ